MGESSNSGLESSVDNNNKSLEERSQPEPGSEDNVSSPSVVKRWTIVLACCWINIAVFAMFKSSGVLYLAILETFEGSTSSEASWQITLINSVSAIASLPAGLMTHYLEIRSIVSAGVIVTSTAISASYFASSISTLNLLLGFFQGIGLGLVFGQLPAIITQYFDPESRAAAVGVSFAGSTIGSIFSPLIFDRLLDSFPLHETCLIMGLLALTSMIGALLLTPHPSSRAKVQATKVARVETETCGSLTLVRRMKEDVQVMKEDVQVMLDPHFGLICLSYSFHYLSSITIMMALPDFAIKCGLSHKESILLLSFISIGNLLGRLSPLLTKLTGSGKLSDKTTFIISTVALPFVYILFPLLPSSPLTSIAPILIQFIILTTLTGYLCSFQLVLAPVLLAEYLGSSKTAVTFGLINSVSGLVSFLRPLIISSVSGNTQNYDVIFYTFAVFPLISACFWIAEIICTKYLKSSNSQTSETMKTRG